METLLFATATTYLVHQALVLAEDCFPTQNLKCPYKKILWGLVTHLAHKGFVAKAYGCATQNQERLAGYVRCSDILGV